VRKYARKSWVWMAAYDTEAYKSCAAAKTFVDMVSTVHRDDASGKATNELAEYFAVTGSAALWLPME